MKDIQHITIHIAGQPPFGLDVPRQREAALRKVEKDINKIWAKWCTDFPSKAPQEVLAMVTFQFARFYYDLLDKVNAGEDALRDFEKRLDDILLDVK